MLFGILFQTNDDENDLEEDVIIETVGQQELLAAFQAGVRLSKCQIFQIFKYYYSPPQVKTELIGNKWAALQPWMLPRYIGILL